MDYNPNAYDHHEILINMVHNDDYVIINFINKVHKNDDENDYHESDYHHYLSNDSNQSYQTKISILSDHLNDLILYSSKLL